MGSGPPPFRPRGPRPRPLPENVRLIHEDEDLLVLSKPPGLPIERVGRGKDLSTFAWAYLLQRDPGAGTKALSLLDDEASGLVVFAKRAKADRMFRMLLEPNKSGRVYTAVLDGVMEGEGSLCKEPIHRSGRGVVEVVRPGMDHRALENSVRAATRFRVLASGEEASVVRAHARTDYPGQVRAHAAAIGRAVLSDRTHNSHRELAALPMHLGEISIPDPRRGDAPLRFVSPPPSEFWTLVGAEPPASTDEDAEIESASVRDAEGAPAGKVSWEHVADWYADLLSSRGSDHHRDVVLPGVNRLLGLRGGESVLDIACGEGTLARYLRGGPAISYTGVDASPALIERAESEARGTERFLVGDARELEIDAGNSDAQTSEFETSEDGASEEGTSEEGAGDGDPGFDAAVCVLALMNIDPMAPVLSRAGELLRPGGRLVIVTLHPAFRAPGRTHWGWATDPRDGVERQFRRVDGYLTKHTSQITMNPGAVSRGEDAITTQTITRPISAYVSTLADSGFVVDSMEEWTSARASEPGPNAEEEDRVRREFPMFLAIRAIRAQDE